MSYSYNIRQVEANNHTIARIDEDLQREGINEHQRNVLIAYRDSVVESSRVHMELYELWRVQAFS